ncbi:MAG TPA: hypothetical protein VGH23_19295 [Rhizomicrobium sp.]|jgi:hypothetical protein
MRFAAAVIAALFLLLLPAMAEPCAVLARQVDAAGLGAAFAASYPVASDRALRNVAFLYDNAAAVLALIGCDDLGRARRIGDAILAAQAQDRFWKDGRLRNGYLAGPVKNPAQLGGWQDGSRWVEDGYQAGSDTGNLAWAILALLGLHHAGAGDGYLSGAIRIAAYVEKSFDPPGFTGGTFGGEPAPQRNSWKSTEHNVDLVAAFSALARATRDPHWAQRADQARGLVAAMWDRHCGCFAAGTGLDGKTPNRFLALDAQLWPLLALSGGVSRYGEALQTAREKMAVGDGFAYSEAGGAMWTEGTAQAALLMALMDQPRQAARLMTAVEHNRAPDGSYFAAGRDTDTGFRLDTDPGQARRYFHMPHLGALAWTAMAQRRFNPFTFAAALPGD